MPTYLLTVRLPTGTEFWYAEREPSVGERIVRRGQEYVVREIEDGDAEGFVVTVAEASPPFDAEPTTP